MRDMFYGATNFNGDISTLEPEGGEGHESNVPTTRRASTATSPRGTSKPLRTCLTCSTTRGLSRETSRAGTRRRSPPRATPPKFPACSRTPRRGARSTPTRRRLTFRRTTARRICGPPAPRGAAAPGAGAAAPGASVADFPEWGVALVALSLALSTITSIVVIARALCAPKILVPAARWSARV